MKRVHFFFCFFFAASFAYFIEHTEASLGKNGHFFLEGGLLQVFPILFEHTEASLVEKRSFFFLLQVFPPLVLSCSSY